MNLSRTLLSLVLLASIARGAAADFSPERLEGLGLWLRATDLRGSHRDGQVVTTWPDQSGNAYDAIYEPRIPQAGLAVGRHNPPTFKADAIAGAPAISFNAANREGLILNWAGHALGQRTKGFTAIFLIKPSLVYGAKPVPDVAWTKNRYVFLTHVSNYNSRFSLQIIEGSGEVKLFSRAAPAQAKVTQNSSFGEGEQVAVSGDEWHRVIGTVDYEAKTARIVIDGHIINRTLPADSANVSEDVPSPITGIGSTTLGDWLTCQIAEAICYQRALTNDELLAIDRYLAAKYQAK